MAGVELPILAIFAFVVFFGAVVQSMIGLGVGLVAAPVMAMLQPDLVPVTLLVLALLMPVVTLIGEHDEIDWAGLSWAVAARIPGTAVGVWLVATVPIRSLAIMVGVMVLVSVLLTWHTVTVPINRVSLCIAGLISGVTGTATSIGGPPMALLYQHRSPVQVRTTLAVYFIVGSVLSMSGLALSGDLDFHDILVALLLAPVLVLGTLVAGWVKKKVDPATIRPGILLVCAASAVVLIVRSLG